LFIVNHANYVHPADAIVVTYKHTEMGDYLAKGFQSAWVNNEPHRCREVYRVDGSTADQQAEVDRFIQAAAAATETHSIQPVLLGHTSVLSVGWNKLQVSEGCYSGTTVGLFASHRFAAQHMHAV
jgi:hypothetical protein